MVAFGVRGWSQSSDSDSEARFQDLVRLVKSGADTNVFMAYVAAAPVPYQLTAEQLTYLADLGVSPETLAKMGGTPPEDGEATPAATPASENNTAPMPNPSPAAVEPPVEAADASSATPMEAAPPPPPMVAPLQETVVYQAPAVVPPPDQLNISFFYETLSPYGNWVSVDGAWCWQPTVVVVDPGWRPYCHRGRWVYTDWGWAWCSDYSWGWAPFHYGRWRHHGRYGWLWTPDTVWGPAWVSWREEARGIGWAPLPPDARYDLQMGFLYAGRSVNADFEFGLQAWDYTFVFTEHFCDRIPARYAMPPSQANRMYAHSAVIPDSHRRKNDRLINSGPPIAHVTAVTHRTIKEIKIVDQSLPPGRPIQRNKLTQNSFAVFRPPVKASAPDTPAVVIARRQVEAAKREEARGHTVLRMDEPAGGRVIQDASARGRASRGLVPAVAGPARQPGDQSRADEANAHRAAEAQAEAAAQTRAQTEKADRSRAQAEAAARLRAQAEAAARVRQEEEAARAQAQAAAAARRRAQAEELAARVKAQTEQAAVLRARAEAEARQQREQGAANFRAQAEAAERQRQAMEARERARQEDDASRAQAQVEAQARLRTQAEAAARVRQEETSTRQPTARGAVAPQKNPFQDYGDDSTDTSASQRGAVSRGRGLRR